MNNNKFSEVTLKTLAVVGAVVVLSFGGFVTIYALSNIPDILSNIGAQVVNITSRFIPNERIVLDLSDNNPRSGDIVKLSFEHISKESDGSYSFFYECRDGIHFERAENSNTTEEIIFCNTPYNFINQDDSISFVVFSTKDERVEVPLSINFVENNSDRISERGEKNISIEGKRGTNDGGTILVTDNSGSGSGSVPRTRGDVVEETFLFDERTGIRQGVSDPNGRVDLKPTIIAVGYIDRTTNVFTATSTISQGQRGAVKFVVENVGTRVSPEWRFSSVLPTFPAFIYHSKQQQKLFPGDRIEYIVGFDSIRNDNQPNRIVVNVDPASSIGESNETNNIVETKLPAFD